MPRFHDRLKNMKESKMRKVIQLVRGQGLLRPRDLDQYGIPREYLNRLYHRGILKRVTRGLYSPSDIDPTDRHTLAETSKLVPKGIVCLLSALRFHELTTQEPFEVWVAIDHKAWRPSTGAIPVRIVRFSGSALKSGIEEHEIERVNVRVYNPAKTVADCFKFRNRIGLDVALEALREGWREHRFTMDELWKYAKICRVSNVIRPYLESLT